ncbi:unnamed protein product [Phytophthora lilii]|uniref:Unnamed protein product n=1 Tax=Phytophthora lilii TaxID=2077276 RepID=A0A9W6U1Z2_9STRA|nr:unnamed protein product [Phytophthora lilii]
MIEIVSTSQQTEPHPTSDSPEVGVVSRSCHDRAAAHDNVAKVTGHSDVFELLRYAPSSPFGTPVCQRSEDVGR